MKKDIFYELEQRGIFDLLDEADRTQFISNNFFIDVERVRSFFTKTKVGQKFRDFLDFRK